MRFAHAGVILLLLVGASRADDWPHWRGPHHDGSSRESGLLPSWPAAGPKVLWRTKLTGGYCSVVAAAGKIITQTKDKTDELILCYDALKGKKLWEHRFPADYGPFKKELDQRWLSGPRSTPAIEGNRVYAIGTLGPVFCLDFETGKVIWSIDLQKMFPRPMPDYGYVTSPFIHGDRLFLHPGAPPGGSLAAFDKHSGKLLWKAQDNVMGWATPIHYLFQGKPQLLMFAGDAAIAVTPDEGKLLWKHPWLTEYQINAATPIYHEGQVFLSSNYAMGGIMLKLKESGDPDVVWKSANMTNHFSTCVLHEGHLYGFSLRRLRCVEWKTGKIQWDEDSIGRGFVTLADGKLFIQTETGEVVMANASPASYEEKGRIELKGGSWSTPALSNGVLYVRGEKWLAALQVR